MQCIKSKYKSSAFQRDYNHEENLLLKYYFRPLKLHGFAEFHYKMRKTSKMSSEAN